MTTAPASASTGERGFSVLTSTHGLDTIRRNTHEMALDLLALGLDPDKATLFGQSARPEHTELAYLLSTVVPVCVGGEVGAELVD